MKDFSTFNLFYGVYFMKQIAVFDWSVIISSFSWDMLKFDLLKLVLAVVFGAVKLAVLIFGAAGVFPLTFSALLQCALVAFEAFSAYYVLNYEEGTPKPRIKWRKGRSHNERSDENFI